MHADVECESRCQKHPESDELTRGEDRKYIKIGQATTILLWCSGGGLLKYQELDKGASCKNRWIARGWCLNKSQKWNSRSQLTNVAERSEENDNVGG